MSAKNITVACPHCGSERSVTIPEDAKLDSVSPGGLAFGGVVRNEVKITCPSCKENFYVVYWP